MCRLIGVLLKVDQTSSDVVVFLRSGYEPGSSGLYTLESGEQMIGNAVQQALSIVTARCHVRGFFSRSR